MSDGGADEGEPTEEAAGSRPPLSDLAERVADRREGADAGTVQDRFAESSVEPLASGAVWEAVEEPDAGEVSAADGETHVVEKTTFCERCPHLSEPPGVRCTHPGTDILEFVDKEHVRVSSCPVVAERSVPDER